eukprot:366471-Chlamydomonas_euryale.AAC.9
MERVTLTLSAEPTDEAMKQTTTQNMSCVRRAAKRRFGAPSWSLISFLPSRDAHRWGSGSGSCAPAAMTCPVP